MPELWIPYGPVETLVTVQAENLGTVVEPGPEQNPGQAERMAEGARRASIVLVCDSTPTTIELVKDIVPALSANAAMKILAAAPKRIEASVPDLKGKISTLPPPVSQEPEGPPVLAPELTAAGRKLFVGTARPDPLFGLVDAKVEACLNWVANSLRESAEVRDEMEPAPFQKTDSWEKMEGIANGIKDATFMTAVPRGGKVSEVLENAPFDAVKAAFYSSSVSPSRAIIVGAGGRGYDDTLSSALRGVWSSLHGVKSSGSVLIVAECSEGLGSTALEMLATGRMSGDAGKKRGKYIEGMEEIFYLNKLKDEYEVLLLSGLPEIYARTKLGLTTARGSGEAVGRLLNRLGRSGKMNVVTRASDCRVESA